MRDNMTKEHAQTTIKEIEQMPATELPAEIMSQLWPGPKWLLEDYLAWDGDPYSEYLKWHTIEEVLHIAALHPPTRELLLTVSREQIKEIEEQEKEEHESWKAFIVEYNNDSLTV